MNDTMADAVFLEHSRHHAKLNRTGWMIQEHSTTLQLRVRLANLLLAAAARLAPATGGSAELTRAHAS